MKILALAVLLGLAGCIGAHIEQNFDDAAPETPAEEPAAESPPAVILEGRVVLPEN